VCYLTGITSVDLIGEKPAMLWCAAYRKLF